MLMHRPSIVRTPIIILNVVPLICEMFCLLASACQFISSEKKKPFELTVLRLDIYWYNH